MALRIGFDRKLQLRWLDTLVDHLSQETDPTATRRFLHELLSADHPSQKARINTVTVLMRMWVTVPPQYEALRQVALERARAERLTDRRWLHWGMAQLAFPLFNSTASTVGRLLAVQGDLTLGQVQRRLAETFGQRSTLERASQRVVRSMVDWGTLVGSERRGGFRRPPTMIEGSVALQLWLLEAGLMASGAEEIEASQLLSAPELFPFHITVRPGDLRQSERFELHRQGIATDIVALRG